MKIDKNEILLLDKINMNNGLAKAPAYNAAEMPVSNPANVMNGLQALGANNLAFHGSKSVLAKRGLGLIAGMMALGGAATMTQSCQPDIAIYKLGPDQPSVYKNGDTIVNVTVENDYSALVAYMMQRDAEFAAREEELMNIIKAIYTELVGIGQTLDNMYDKLTDMGLSVNQIVNLMLSQGENMNDILAVLQRHGKTLEEISTNLTENMPQLKDALKDILISINAGNKLTAEQNQLLDVIISKMNAIQSNDAEAVALLNKALALLNKIVNNQDDGNTKLDKIIDRMEAIISKLNEMDASTKAYFLKLLDKIDNLELQPGDNSKVLELLQKILDVSTANLANNKEMSANQQAFFDAVLDKLNGLSDAGEAALNAVLDAIKNNTYQITTAINGLGTKGMDALNEILKAIQENTKVAQGTYDITVLILANLDKLGNKADDIIDAIKNLSITGGGTVDLSDVTALLQQILDQDKANGQTLTEIYNKIKNLPDKIDTIIEKLQKMPEAGEYTKLLEEIRDKIKPCECNCGDLSDILLEIKVVIEEIKEGINNEGIIDDLDDLLS